MLRFCENTRGIIFFTDKILAEGLSLT